MDMRMYADLRTIINNKIVELAREGKAQREIALELKIRRNIVAGVIHRARHKGLLPFTDKTGQSRPTYQPKARDQKERPRGAPYKRPVTVPRVECLAPKDEPSFCQDEGIKPFVPLPDTPEGMITIQEIKMGMCCWPLERKEDILGKWTFCGREAVHPTDRWCEEHRELVYIKVGKLNVKGITQAAYSKNQFSRFFAPRERYVNPTQSADTTDNA